MCIGISDQEVEYHPVYERQLVRKTEFHLAHRRHAVREARTAVTFVLEFAVYAQYLAEVLLMQPSDFAVDPFPVKASSPVICVPLDAKKPGIRSWKADCGSENDNGTASGEAA